MERQAVGIAVFESEKRRSLLGGRVVAFDMRAPDRIYFRVPGRTEDEARAAAAAAAAKAAAAADRADAAKAAGAPSTAAKSRENT